MSTRRLAGFAAVAFAAAVAVAAPAGGDLARTVVVEPPGLGLSFAVPSGWRRGCDNGTTPRFSIGPPGQVAKVDVYTSTPAASLAALRPVLITELRRRLGRDAVRASGLRLASGTPALRLGFHYRGVWSCGSTGVAEIRHALYLVVHGGTLYTFDFVGIDPWTSSHAATFDRTARSIRFVDVA